MIRSYNCSLEDPTKDTEGRKWLFSTTHTRRIEGQPNFKECYCPQMKLWHLMPQYNLRAKIMAFMKSTLDCKSSHSWNLLTRKSLSLLTWGNQHCMSQKDPFILIPFVIFPSNCSLLDLERNRLLTKWIFSLTQSSGSQKIRSFLLPHTCKLMAYFLSALFVTQRAE